MYVHRAFITPKVEPPCMDCPDRVVGCHSKCDKYKEYSQTLRKNQTEITEKYKSSRMAENYTQQKYEKLKRQGKVRW